MEDDSSIEDVTHLHAERVVWLTIPFPPAAQQRPRTSWRSNHRYSPSSAQQQQYRQWIEENRDDIVRIGPFDANERIIIKVWYFMPRPINDFVNRDRDRLRTDCRSTPWVPVHPDIDNYIKFTLDALRGTILTDDRQVVSIYAWKRRDNNGRCQGMTKLEVRTFNPNLDYLEPQF